MKRSILIFAALFLLSVIPAEGWKHGKICNSILLNSITNFVGWSQIDGTITPNGGASTPNITLSARFVEGSSLASDHLVFFEGVFVTPNALYQYSVFAKPVLTSPHNRLAKLQLASAGYTADIDGFFDVRTGTIFFVTPASASDLTLGSSFIKTFPNGWYQIGFSFTAATSTVNILIGQATSGGNGTYDGDGTSATDYWTPSICPL